MHAKLEAGDRWALLDCDDVLLDYIEGFTSFVMRIKGLKKIAPPDSWDMTGWLGMNRTEALSLINQFNDTDIGFERLKPVHGAIKGVRRLKTFGFRTAIITSSSVSPSSVERRARNVTAVFGDLIDRLHIVPLGQSKRDTLLNYQNAIWVEDNVPNAAMGAATGHRAFLLPAHHNTKVHGRTIPDPGVSHVSGWEDIVIQAISLVPDVRTTLGVRDASLRALERASETAGHKTWTPRNPESDAMKRLVEYGVVSLTRHPNRRPTAELTSIGFVVLGLDPQSAIEPDEPDFDI